MLVCYEYIGFSPHGLSIKYETRLFSLKNSQQITFSYFNFHEERGPQLLTRDAFHKVVVGRPIGATRR
jgi:hypothetical protein